MNDDSQAWADMPSSPVPPRLSSDAKSTDPSPPPSSSPSLRPDPQALPEEAETEKPVPDTSPSPSPRSFALAPPSTTFAEPEDDGFDDDPFDVPPAPSTSDAFAGDDDFGDFGDFGDVGDVGDNAFDDIPVESLEISSSSTFPADELTSPPPPAPRALSSLHLKPLPDAQTLSQTIQAILGPVFPNLDVDAQLGHEDVRQVEGPGQVLVDESSRRLLNSLTETPTFAPLDWTRSRVRRKHLISLGVPVDLDEVSSQRTPSLPPLRISTLPSSSSLQIPAPPRPSSTVPVARPPTLKRSNTIGGSSESTSTRRETGTGGSIRGGRTPGGPPSENVDVSRSQNRSDKSYGLGKQPEMDTELASELLSKTPDALSLLPLSTLEALQDSLTHTTAQASMLLSHLLQLRDAQKNEALVSNGLIGELVQNAAKAAMAAKTGGGSSGGWRRSMASGSGRSSPAG